MPFAKNVVSREAFGRTREEARHAGGREEGKVGSGGVGGGDGGVTHSKFRRTKLMADVADECTDTSFSASGQLTRYSCDAHSADALPKVQPAAGQHPHGLPKIDQNGQILDKIVEDWMGTVGNDKVRVVSG